MLAYAWSFASSAAVGLGLPDRILPLAKLGMGLVGSAVLDLVDLLIERLLAHLLPALVQLLQLDRFFGPPLAMRPSDHGRSRNYLPDLLRRRENHVRRLRQVQSRWQSVLGLELGIVLRQAPLLVSIVHSVDGCRTLVVRFWRKGRIHRRGGVHLDQGQDAMIDGRLLQRIEQGPGLAPLKRPAPRARATCSTAAC